MAGKLFRSKKASVLSCALFCVLFILTASASAAAWRFGIISDTQWKTSPDGKNPNYVAVNVINHLNQEFIDHGVKFVVAVGGVTQNGDILGMDTSATFRQALYNAGIGFYPLRGNHEASASAAAEFQRVFPPTWSGANNQTPADALVTTPYYGAPPVDMNFGGGGGQKVRARSLALRIQPRNLRCRHADKNRLGLRQLRRRFCRRQV